MILPFPPSVNAMWRTPYSGPLAGRTLLSQEGRKYRKEVQRLAVVHRWPTHDAQQRLSVRIVAHMPDRRRRDLDNLLKAALDGLTHAGVMADDSQIDTLSIERAEDGCGFLQVLIERIGNTPQKPQNGPGSTTDPIGGTHACQDCENASLGPWHGYRSGCKWCLERMASFAVRMIP